MKKSKHRIKRNFEKSVSKGSQKNNLKIRRKVFNTVHKHCISLWIASSTNVISTEKPKLGFFSVSLLSKEPENIRSGTLTLVKTNNRYFGITCHHVVTQLEKENQKVIAEFVEKGYVESADADNIDFNFFHLTTTVKNNINLSKYTFLRPNPQYPDPMLDIRIAELDESIINAMGKLPIDLDINEEVPDNLTFAIAVGYPENLKKLKKHEIGSSISMPCSTVVAELQKTPKYNFTLHSIIEEEVDRNFSGMSGGPIFWQVGMNYNILGIIFESPNRQYGTFGPNEIVISGELATPTLIKGWIHDLFS